MQKVVNTTRTSSWPMHGGLQSITNTTSFRNGGARGPMEVSTKQISTVPVIPEQVETQVVAKTPSPKKVTIKVEPASGKENSVAV
jgi:hypothetical protein